MKDGITGCWMSGSGLACGGGPGTPTPGGAGVNPVGPAGTGCAGGRLAPGTPARESSTTVPSITGPSGGTVGRGGGGASVIGFSRGTGVSTAGSRCEAARRVLVHRVDRGRRTGHHQPLVI